MDKNIDSKLGLFFGTPYQYKPYERYVDNINTKIAKILKDEISSFNDFWWERETYEEEGETLIRDIEDIESSHYFEQIFEYLESFDKTTFISFPITLVENLSNYLNSLDKFFDKIKGNKYSNEEKRELEKELKSLCLKIQENGGRVLLWNDLLNKQQELSKIISDFWEIKNPSIQALENSWDVNIKKSKELIATSAAIHHANNFNEQSQYHIKQSKFWLSGAFFILVVIFLVGLYLLNKTEQKDFLDNMKEVNNNLFIYLTTSRIILLVVLFYALSVSIKNYKAHQHNMLINKHRYNALCTYDFFISTSNDDEAKKSMLNSVFNTIFINQSTSYENEYSSPKDIIEPVKDLFSKRG